MGERFVDLKIEDGAVTPGRIRNLDGELVVLDLGTGLVERAESFVPESYRDYLGEGYRALMGEEPTTMDMLVEDLIRPKGWGWSVVYIRDREVFSGLVRVRRTVYVGEGETAEEALCEAYLAAVAEEHRRGRPRLWRRMLRALLKPSGWLRR